MRSRLHQNLWPHFHRKVCSALTLCAYLSAAIGMPLPAQSRSANHCGEVCACPSAAQAAHECCCSGGVNEPQTSPVKSQSTCPFCAEAEDGESAPITKPASEQPERKPCCTPMESNDGSEVSPDCIEGELPTPPAPDWYWQSGLSALQCKGLSILWVTSGAASVADAPLGWSPLLVPLEWLCVRQLDSHLLNSVPDTPPPRFLSV